MLTGVALAVAAVSIGAPTIMAQATVEFPLTIGVLPSYDRINGLSLRLGPTVTFGEDERFVISPMLTYRSHLGKIDPSLAVVGQITPDSSLGFSLTGSRGTFTNDGWMRSNLINSLVSLGLGHDSRNYFRGDRGEARLTSTLKLPLDVATVFVGARTERDWSTGWRGGDDMGPFSFFGRSDTTNGIQRPNPLISAGHISSAIAGGHFEYVGLPGSAMFDVLFEASGKTPTGGNFQQLTLDQVANIETIGDQHIEIGSHLVTTSTSSFTPQQRFAYVGGSGSLATVDLLGLGGDHLYFVDVLYVIPISKIEIPLLGSPYIAPHFASGAASVGGFGRPVQNIGGRLGVSIFTVDYLINPRTHQHDFGAGIAIRQ
jgi:hypothetical protein